MDWKRLLKAIGIVAITALIFFILAVFIEWLANNHPTLLAVGVIVFFVSLVTGMIYFLLGELDD